MTCSTHILPLPEVMSAPQIFRDDFGLPVKASVVTVITRDECGLPVRSLQRTISQQPDPRPLSADKSTPAVSASETVSSPLTKVATVRDEAGFPVKKITAPSGFEISRDAPLARAASEPSTIERGSKHSIFPLMKLRSQYSIVDKDSGGAEEVELPPPPHATAPESVQTRRERSTDLSAVLQRMDSHLADHGHGHDIVCHDAVDDYAMKKFYARNQGMYGDVAAAYVVLPLIIIIAVPTVYGYPGSTGTVSSNYIRFVAQQHPLISIALVNPKHPFTRKNRIIVFICVLAFAFFVEIALLDSFYYSDYEVCKDGCSEQNGVCVGGDNDGMTESE